MITPLISRERECKQLQRCLESDRSELIVVYGRRRIGKTYLIESFFNAKYDFTFVGERGTPAKVQIQDFVRALEKQSKKKAKPKNVTTWFDAFHALEDYLETLPEGRKKTIFIDEMPWMDTQRSNFVKALENFWNGWANRRKDVVLIATGSATSWMADKIQGNKGGLHARITCNLHLSAFNLHETEDYLRLRNCCWDRYQILQCYMVFGGVPFYLSLLDVDLSLAQNIDILFFEKGAALRDEFDELYTALFDKADSYVDVVKLLSQNKAGMMRNEILAATGIEGAFLTKVLKNLERSDFVTRLSQFGKKDSGSVYKLSDFFTLYYYKFIAGNNSKDGKWWSNNLDSASIASWMGLGYENVCLCHLEQIKSALGIAGVGTSLYTWKSKANKAKGIPGFQIDMIIERADRLVHLCEMKFSRKKYAITADYEDRLRERMALFELATGCKQSLVHTFITTYGVVDGMHKSIVHSEITMDDLFKF